MASAPKPRNSVVQMSPYRPPLEDRGRKLRLDFNENLVGCSPQVLKVLQESPTRDFLGTYPEYSKAKQKLGKHFGVGSGQVLLGAGTDELINAVLNTYANPGDEVLMPHPTFSMFRFYSELLGAVPRKIPYTPPDLAFPVQEFIQAIGPDTRAICIASPNNPTGGVLTVEEAEQILAVADGCAVLIDEAYFDFHGKTMLDILPKWPNLFISRTFSKAYGMAGLRIGCLITSAENAANTQKVQSPYSINSLAVRCMLAAIDDRKYVQDYARLVLRSRDLLCESLRELEIRYWPSHANFLLLDLGEKAAYVCNELVARDILVRDQSPHIAGAVRVTVGTLQQTVHFLTNLREVLDS